MILKGLHSELPAGPSRQARRVSEKFMRLLSFSFVEIAHD